MSEVKSYELREYVKAERVEAAGYVNTRSGREHVREGAYKVYGDNGVRIVRAEAFDNQYVEVEKTTMVSDGFNPTGKTVEQVVEYMKLNPDEVEHVKNAENSGASRKGILEY